MMIACVGNALPPYDNDLNVKSSSFYNQFFQESQNKRVILLPQNGFELD
jgi:hypothetical protein